MEGTGLGLRIVAAVAALAVLVGCSDTAPPEQAQGGELAATPAAVGQRPTVELPGGAPPRELVAEDLVVGSGPQADEDSTVTIHYVGVAWSTGQEFDSSWERGNPRTFALVGTIEGFRRGVAGMAVGGRRRIVIPAELAYGDDPPAGVRADETLVFVVDLVALR